MADIVNSRISSLGLPWSARAGEHRLKATPSCGLTLTIVRGWDVAKSGAVRIGW
jgi:hypothetical protein